MEKRILEPGAGRIFDVLGGDQITIKITGDDTDGQFAVVETVVPPGGGPPRHLHRRESETFFVLEGKFEFQIEDESVIAEAGSMILAPKNLPHQFRNIAQQPGKLLIVCQPAGFEKFVEEFAKIPADVPPNPEQLAEIGGKFGIEFLPPAE